MSIKSTLVAVAVAIKISSLSLLLYCGNRWVISCCNHDTCYMKLHDREEWDGKYVASSCRRPVCKGVRLQVPANGIFSSSSSLPGSFVLIPWFPYFTLIPAICTIFTCFTCCFHSHVNDITVHVMVLYVEASILQKILHALKARHFFSTLGSESMICFF